MAFKVNSRYTMNNHTQSWILMRTWRAPYPQIISFAMGKNKIMTAIMTLFNNVFTLEQWYINLWCPPIMCHLAYSLIIKPRMMQRAVIFSSDTAATFPSTTRAQEFCFEHLGWTWLTRAVTESFYSSDAIMIRSNGALSNSGTFPTLDILLACLQASWLVDIYTTSLI